MTTARRASRKSETESAVDLGTITEVFRPFLVHYLDPNSLFSHFMSLRLKLGAKYRNIHEASLRSQSEGMTLLLDAIHELPSNDKRGISSDFMNALRRSGNRFMHDVITGKEKLDERWELYKLLLQTEKDFMKIPPQDLMPHLLCLNAIDRERINATVRMYGNICGARELFLRLEAKPPESIYEISRGLKKIGFCEISCDLEEGGALIAELGKSEEDEDANKKTSECKSEVDNATSSASGTCPPEDNIVVSTEVVEEIVTSGETQATPPTDSAGGLDDMLESLSMQSTRRKDERSSQQTSVQIPPPPVMDPKSLNLHDYQEELAKPALCNKNTIIVAPTGSGKTRVAIAIAMHVLQEGQGASYRPCKVIFVVNKVPLVEQQKKAFQAFIGDVVGISGDMSSQVPLAEQLQQASVIVLTAQILVNAIQDGSFSLASLGLLIMDECHNTQKGSAYSILMANYRDFKREHPDQHRPQVVGLTASLGVKKAKRQKDAVDHVLKLCANLDAEWISTVRKYKESLRTSYHRPIEKTFRVSGRDDKDPFKCVLGEIMEKIETTIFNTNEGEEILKKHHGMKELSSNRGTQQYEGEISKLINYVPLKVENAGRARALLECANFLQIYNQSLYINRDARTTDAVNYVNIYIKTLKAKNQHEGSIMPKLIKLFEEKQDRLDEICRGETNENPVLKKLEEILERAYDEEPETLAILFTNTRDSTRALEAWMQASPKLSDLNPGILTGTGKGSGTTQAQTEKLLAMFKETKHRLVISTSVAEEGLDIQMCNLVLRYNYVRDDIGRVQARGRSRAKGGKFYLIFNERLPHLAERERMNIIREVMMQKATETVCDMIHSNEKEYQEIVEKLQRDDRSERTLKKSGTAAAKKRMAAQRIHSEVSLICKHCREFACYADDVKCINSQHHIVMSEGFEDRITMIDLAEERDLYGGVTATKEIQCKKCKKKWGYSMIYKGHELPLLTISCLVIEISKGNRFNAKKWKEVPFKVKEIDLEDLTERLNVEEEEEAVNDKELE